MVRGIAKKFSGVGLLRKRMSLLPEGRDSCGEDTFVLTVNHFPISTSPESTS